MCTSLHCNLWHPLDLVFQFSLFSCMKLHEMNQFSGTRYNLHSGYNLLVNEGMCKSGENTKEIWITSSLILFLSINLDIFVFDFIGFITSLLNLLEIYKKRALIGYQGPASSSKCRLMSPLSNMWKSPPSIYMRVRTSKYIKTSEYHMARSSSCVVS